MRLRLVTTFLFIVLVPLGVLVWLGLRVARNERELVKHQFESVLTERLADLDGTVRRTIQEVERTFLSRTELASGDSKEAIWELIRTQPLLRQVFVVLGDGALLHPGSLLSQEEKEFLKRTAPIWKREAVLYSPPPSEGRGRKDLEPSAANQANQPQPQAQGAWMNPPSQAPFGATILPGQRHGDSILDLARRQPHGWISWYWEEGLHLLFWRRRSGGGVVGVEVERIALLARVVGKLPSEAEAGRILLADSRGEPVYQWGPYEVKGGEQPIASLALTYPLNSWKLEYFASPDQKAAFFGSGLGSGFYLSLGAFALALVGLAIYFYREYSRDIREAAQRVGFVTQVSHELKTPLTNIRLYAEMLEDSFPEEGAAGRKLSVIVHESQRLSRLISNILTFSKQKKNSIAVRRRRVDLNEVVSGVVDQFRPSLETKEIEIDLVIGELDPVEVDPDLIEQILANLISNVEKYGAEGKRIEVRTEPVGNRASVLIADWGPGVSQSHRNKIFQPFYRVSNKLSDGVAGTGIGLSIARDLARLHGADLVYEERAKGACFRLTLPRGTP